MKHQKLSKKLALNKQTVADLGVTYLNKLRAGQPTIPDESGGTTCNPCPCLTFTDCATEVCVCPTVPVSCELCETVTTPFCC